MAGEGDGDGDPLAHSARQLVRIFGEAAASFGDAYEVEQFQGTGSGFGARHLEVIAERFGDLSSDLHHRVERGHRVLENHRHLDAPEVLGFGAGEILDVFAFK